MLKDRRFKINVPISNNPEQAIKVLACLSEKLRLQHNNNPNRKNQIFEKLFYVDSLYAKAREALFAKNPNDAYNYVPFDSHEFLKSSEAKSLVDSFDESDIEVYVETPKQDDPLENFTTYTELDPNNRIAITNNSISGRYYINETAYVYKDFGNGFFGDSFTHLFEAKLIGGSAFATVWAVSNSIGHAGTTSGGWLCPPYAQAVGCFFYCPGRIYIRDYENGTSDQDYVAIQNRTLYYCKIVRSSTVLQLSVYTDSNRTNLVGSKAVTLTSGRTYRYLFATQTHNNNFSKYIDTLFQNLDLGIQLAKPWLYFNVNQLLE